MLKLPLTLAERQVRSAATEQGHNLRMWLPVADGGAGCAVLWGTGGLRRRGDGRFRAECHKPLGGTDNAH